MQCVSVRNRKGQWTYLVGLEVTALEHLGLLFDLLSNFVHTGVVLVLALDPAHPIGLRSVVFDRGVFGGARLLFARSRFCPMCQTGQTRARERKGFDSTPCKCDRQVEVGVG